MNLLRFSNSYLTIYESKKMRKRKHHWLLSDVSVIPDMKHQRFTAQYGTQAELLHILIPSGISLSCSNKTWFSIYVVIFCVQLMISKLSITFFHIIENLLRLSSFNEFEQGEIIFVE